MRILFAGPNDTKFSIFAHKAGAHNQLISYVDLKDFPGLLAIMQDIGHMPRLRASTIPGKDYSSITYRSFRAQRLILRARAPDEELP